MDVKQGIYLLGSIFVEQWMLNKDFIHQEVSLYHLFYHIKDFDGVDL